MKAKLVASSGTILLLAALASVAFAEEPTNGTLILDLRNYESDVKIKENIEKQLEHGGLEWGIVDNVVVIPLINKKFVKPEMSYMTRWGDRKSLELKPGEYKITCIGYVHSSNSRNVDKVLSASAFFNIDVMTFSVFPGKTTTLEILPTIQKQTKSSFVVKVKLFIPDLKVKVIEDGAQKAEAVISERTATSVPWDDYSGPLKF